MRERMFPVAVQVLTGLSILAGLALVVYELRQNRTLSQSQLASEAVALIHSRQISGVGENVSEVMAKACTTPEELNDGELLVMHNYFGAILSEVSRLHLMTEFGYVIANLPNTTSATVRQILSFPLGANWLKLNGPSQREEIRRVISIELVGEQGRCIDYLKALQGRPVA